MSLQRVALVGGPQGGKSTVIDKLTGKYENCILAMPEVPSALMEKLVPLPGRDLALDDRWLFDFQHIVFPTQKFCEDMWCRVAATRGCGLIFFDRGILDGAAYIPGGLPRYLETFGINCQDIFARYDAVIHLETLAKSKPEAFGKTNNDQRYETSAEAAIALDEAIQAVWKLHPNWLFIPSNLGIDNIVHEVEKTILPFLSLPTTLKT